MNPKLAARIAAVVVAIVALQFLAIRSFAQYQSEAYVSESRTASDRGLPGKARQPAQRAAQLNPLNGYAHFYLGTSAFLQKNYDEAVAAFTQAVRYMPHTPNVLRLLGQAYFYRNEYDDAGHVMQRYFRMHPDPGVTPEYLMRIWTVALYRGGEYGKAAANLTDAERSGAHRLELLQLRVVGALMLNQISMADYLYRRFRHHFPAGQVVPAEILARALDENKLKTSIRFFETIRMRGNADLSTLKVLALAYSKENRLQEAITVLNQAARVSEKDPEVYLMLGDVHFHKGDRASAARYYKQHLDLMPASPYRDEIAKKMSGRR